MKKTNVLKCAAIAALFSLLALAGCNNAVDSEARSASFTASGQLFGYVTDTKGEPLSGVTIALGDKITTTNEAGAFAFTGIPVNATETDTAGTISTATGTTQTYTLTAKKDGYLSSTLTGIVVVETTDKSDSALLLATAASAYQTILEEFAKADGTGATTISSGSVVATDGVVLNSQNINETYKGMADAYASLIERYQSLSKTYESTFVTTALTPCNGWFEGSLKITKSPEKDITTDAASIKAAPEGVKVKLVTAPATGFTSYVYESTTDKDGKFKFENLPVDTELTLKVEGFEATYESGEDTIETYYYSLMDSTTASTAKFTYPGTALQEDTLTIKLEEKSGAKFKADVLLYSQPAKIIVTETNLLQNTAVAPLALDTPVTVTFNKPMDYVELVTETGVTTVKEIGEKANYVFDESKKKVTITPKDGFWTASSEIVTFVINGRAQDGATSFIDNKFTVKLDNIIKVKFADVSDADKDAFTLTFDRELVKTDAVKVKDDKSEALTLSWNKENVSAPVLTVKARDGKFAKPGDHTFTISNVEAKDESNVLYSFDREFAETTTHDYTFKVRFDGFKAVSIDVVEKAEGSLSRSIVATTAQYLKITFNRNVSDASGLTLKDSALTANIAKYKYIKDNAVYISLADFEDKKTLTLSGSVISTSGEKFDGTGDVKWADLLTDYTVRTAYVIAATNLYVEKSSINTNNDKTTDEIKSGEEVTLTFNKEIPANAVLETELYKAGPVVDLEQTPYKATATASGKVVKVTLSESLPGQKYYLSLKIKSADGAELFSTGSASFGTGKYTKNLYVEDKIVYKTSSTTNTKKYIEIKILAVKLLPEGSSKTTKAAEFKKSSNGSIVLQFNQDVTGYKAFLYNTYGSYTTIQNARNALATNFVNLANAQKALFYGAKSTVDGDTITITPDYSFASNDNPGIAVYNADGEWVELGTTPNGGTTPAPYRPYASKTYADKLAPENASQTDAFKVTPAKSSGYNEGDKAELTFKMLAKNKYTNELPTFTLYKKVKNGFGDDEWLKVKDQDFVKSNDKGEFSYKDFKVDNADAYIEVSEGAELTYGSEELVLLTTINHMVIRSNIITISK